MHHLLPSLRSFLFGPCRLPLPMSFSSSASQSTVVSVGAEGSIYFWDLMDEAGDLMSGGAEGADEAKGGK